MVAAGERPPTSSHNASYYLSKILPDSWACRLFVITVLVETTVDLAIEGDLLVRLQDSGDNESALKMPVYLSVFALAQYASPFTPRLCFNIQPQYISACPRRRCSVRSKYPAIHLSHVSWLGKTPAPF